MGFIKCFYRLSYSINLKPMVNLTNKTVYNHALRAFSQSMPNFLVSQVLCWLENCLQCDSKVLIYYHNEWIRLTNGLEAFVYLSTLSQAQKRQYGFCHFLDVSKFYIWQHNRWHHCFCPQWRHRFHSFWWKRGISFSALLGHRYKIRRFKCAKLDFTFAFLDSCILK